jgi:UDP-N-acetylglucosamine transferase subunit ALG13
MTAQTAGQEITARVVVTVGTDHHPFDRIIHWVNRWLAGHPEQADAFFVQSGTTTVGPRCRSSKFLDTHQLDGLLDGAQVLVCHGGPASLASAWQRGLLPIVVPRLHQLGEHVDDHQLDFCTRVAELGRVRLARTQEQFDEFLQQGGGPSSALVRDAHADVEAATARFAALVDDLVSRGRRPPSLLNLTRRARPGKKATLLGACASLCEPGRLRPWGKEY